MHACVCDAANFVTDQRTDKAILGVGLPSLCNPHLLLGHIFDPEACMYDAYIYDH